MQDAAQQSVRQTDTLDPARARALQVTLGLAPSIETGTPLPPFFHQIYFWDAQPAEALGRDGHPKVGGLIPDMGLPRRMWAGGRLAWTAPLCAGQAAEKTSTVDSTALKEGRSGKLAFVTVRHEIRQDGALCVTEWQDLVYREAPRADAPKPLPPTAGTDCDTAETALFDTTMLFRYSALTFNGHRIHYDIEYANQIEGYDGLVVHGPLLAQKLMLLAQSYRPLAEFSFRGTAPLMHTEAAVLCRQNDALWVRGPDGRLCMSATASWA